MQVLDGVAAQLETRGVPRSLAVQYSALPGERIPAYTLTTLKEYLGPDYSGTDMLLPSATALLQAVELQRAFGDVDDLVFAPPKSADMTRPPSVASLKRAVSLQRTPQDPAEIEREYAAKVSRLHPPP